MINSNEKLTENFVLPLPRVKSDDENTSYRWYIYGPI